MRKYLILSFVILGLVEGVGSSAGKVWAESDYIIGVGDKINISVWGNKDLNSNVVVRPDGKISFHLIGEVRALGLTPLQLRALVTKKLAEFINNPEVTITLTGMRSFVVYIYGNVPKAGQMALRGNTNLLQFFSILGPLPGKVDLKTSFLVRGNKTEEVSFYQLLKEGDLSQNIYLKPGDTLFFKEKPPKPKVVEVKKPVKKKDLFKNKIRILGEVRKQGIYEYKEGMTILDAILTAGSFTLYARPSGTIVSRRVGDRIEEIRIDMDAVREGAIDKNIPLKPGDLISIPASVF